MALNLEDINIKNQKFQVLGKGNKQRWCFYSNDAANALFQYLNYSRHKSISALFTAQHPVTLKVSRISYHTLHDYWREITNNYPELNGVRIHDLRHTFAGERVGLVSLEELRALMGHESIQTTLRYQKGNRSGGWSMLHPGRARARGEARFAKSRRTAFPWIDASWRSSKALRQGKAAASESSPLLGRLFTYAGRYERLYLPKPFFGFGCESCFVMVHLKLIRDRSTGPTTEAMLMCTAAALIMRSSMKIIKQLSNQSLMGGRSPTTKYENSGLQNH